MTDCHNSEMQDRLPEFAAGALDPAAHAAVEAHVAGCPPCAADLVLLRQLRQWHVAVPAVDPGRISAAVRSDRVSTAPFRPAGMNGTRPAAPRRWHGAPLRAAAMVVLVLGGGAVLQRVASGGAVTLAGVDSVPSVRQAPIATAGGGGEEFPVPRVAVSYGDLGDYSTEEMDAVLARLERWDGAPSAEPMGSLPVVAASGGMVP